MKLLNDQKILKIEKLNKLKLLGFNPYPSYTFKLNNNIKNIFKNYKNYKNNFKNISIAGRLMSKRLMGHVSFSELKDHTGVIQLYIKKNNLYFNRNNILYDIYKKYINIGDIIGITGFVFITKVKELSICVKNIIILSKSINSLPVVKEVNDKNGVKFYNSFSNVEYKYRYRYLDLIINNESKERFNKRFNLVSFIRNYLDYKKYLEVETPILQNLYGGALARPFRTYHNDFNFFLYLRISNELYLKRLIISGYSGVYEFSKDFRNEGMSRFHNTEFTQLELYVSYKDYLWMLNMVEKMINELFINVCNNSLVKVGDNLINFSRFWNKFTLFESIENFVGISINFINSFELMNFVKELLLFFNKSLDISKIIDEVFSLKCEPYIIQPTFIIDYPIIMSPLAKVHYDNINLVERFEVICNRKEICNSFSELNDPIEQKKRFEYQNKLKKIGDKEAMVLDEDFLKSLSYGMPPTSGIGIGIDRLAMILSNSDSIQDVIFFPQMKL